MNQEDLAKDHAGLIAVRLTAGGDLLTDAKRVVSSALMPFAAEPLDWEEGSKTLARVHVEGRDPTTSRRVLAIEHTLAAALAIRESLAALGVAVAMGCDVEPTDAEPTNVEYWVRRQRLDVLIHVDDDQTLCRRELASARPLAMDRLQAHLEPAWNGQAFKLEAGPATSLEVGIGRWVTPYVERIPPEWIRDGLLHSAAINDRRDLGRIAWPTSSTRIILVLAEAWTGKSFIARRLEEALRARDVLVEFTSFETNAPWWPDDTFMQAARPRVWIVDATDEAPRRNSNFKRLESASRGSALTTLVFGRPDATLAELEMAIGLSPERRSRDRAERLKVRLLSLDPQQARRELAAVTPRLTRERIDTTLERAAAFVTVPLAFEELLELGRIEDSYQPPSLHELRRRVARRRCTRWRAGLEGTTSHSEDELFRSAQLLAAIAVLANESRFHFGEPGPGFSINSVMPDEILRGGAGMLRATPAVVRVGSAWSFSAAHLEEDLAAIFLADAIREDRLHVPALRSLLTDGKQPRPELQRVIARLREALPADGGALLQGALTVFLEPGEEIAAFRSLVAELRNSSDLVWAGSWPLHRFAGPDIRAEVSELLTRPPGDPAHDVAIRVALENDWIEFAPSAGRIALSDAAPPEIRVLAVYLASKMPETLDQLRPLLTRVGREQPGEGLARLRALLVLELLRAKRLSALEAAQQCPPPEPFLTDARSMAVAEVARQLDEGGARAVLDELRGAIVPRTIDESVADELREAAISAFLTAPFEPNDDEVDRLVYCLSFPDILAEVVGRQRPLTELQREAVYRRMVKEGQPTLFFSAERDAEWLVGYADSHSAPSNATQGDLYASVLWLDGRGQAELAERGRSVLRRLGSWDRFEEQRAREMDWKSQQEKWLDARQRLVDQARNDARPIETVVDTILGERRDPSLRLDVLGDFFFDERWNARNVVGTLEDLPENKRLEVMEATRLALEQAAPLPIPGGNSYSSSLVYEGKAFTAVALWNREWLDRSLIARWLPAALFVATQARDRIEDLLETCFTVGPAETRRAVVGDMLNRARQGYSRTHVIPPVLWSSPQFRSEVLALVASLADGSGKEQDALGQILEALLDSYDEPIAPPEVRAVMDKLRVSPVSSVAQGALRAWFWKWPADSVDHALEAARSFDEAESIFRPYHRGMRRAERVLPLPVLARLTRHLLPPLIPVTEQWTGRRGGPIEGRVRLQEWRDDLVRRCIEVPKEDFGPGEDQEIVATLRAIDEHEPYRTWRARRAAHARIAPIFDLPAWPVPSPEDVALILRGALALVHNDSDLASLVADILRREEWDAADVDLLYDDDGAPRDERTLQVMVRRTLRQGLEKARPRVEVMLFREPNERGSDEPDFVVAVTTRQGITEVPIEVKWSHNDHLVEGLEKQLGERYLGKAHRTHGVFVVGWTGIRNDDHWDVRVEQARTRQAAKGRSILVVPMDVRRKPGRLRP